MSNGLDEPLELQITVNGSAIEGLLYASIASSNCFSADFYALTLALGPPPMGDVAFWSSLSSACVQISATASSGLYFRDLISGLVDTIRLDPINGTVSIDGRDLSAPMIDAYRQQDFVNQTASEVVSLIAASHSLTPAVSETRGNVGRYYDDGYTRLSLGQFSQRRSDWDLVVELARENDFDVYVSGSTLYFQPANAAAEVPVPIAFRDTKRLSFERSLSIDSIAARVQSWNSQDMMSYDSNGAAAGSAVAQGSSSAGPQPFLFAASNLTSQQVTNAVERYATELNRLGTVAHIEMPWDLRLWARTMISISETDSAFDGAYRIDRMQRLYSTTSGSAQIIRATLVGPQDS